MCHLAAFYFYKLYKFTFSLCHPKLMIQVSCGYLQQEKSKISISPSTSNNFSYDPDDYAAESVPWGSLNQTAFPYFSNIGIGRIFQWDSNMPFHYSNDVIPFQTKNIKLISDVSETKQYIGYKLNGFTYGADYALYKSSPKNCHSFALVINKKEMEVQQLMQHVRIAKATKKKFIWNSLEIEFAGIDND
eukprot:NODE_10_length_61504_cov_0.956502.p39 type:complete len:189 gc:universal NODE_10_length_61504_cov_0.956502:56841-56275(-)